MAISTRFKLFKIRGGVHPDDRKKLSAEKAIVDLPISPLLYIPLQQHIGKAAKCLVRRGEQVKKGQLLAQSQGAVSAPIHAPTSGTVVEIADFPAHHPSGLEVKTITLKADMQDEWPDSLPAQSTAGAQFLPEPLQLSADEIADQVAQAGIVGLGGATFPSAIKLKLSSRYAIHTLVINGAECEPYLTCDDRLMQEEAADIIHGVRLMAKALGVKKIIIAIENNKPNALQVMSLAAKQHPEIQVAGLPARYPMGSEKHLVQALTGKETPARGLTADIGIVVHNVATALAVHQALQQGIPLISRVITVSGNAIAEPQNIRALIGTPIAELINFCGGYKQPPAQLISGGPMMGFPLTDSRIPVVKGSNGLLALTAQEIKTQLQMPCIRCSSCVQACPCGLIPLEIAAHIRSGSLDAAVKSGLMDCISCGSCAYTCPSHIPLVQYFNYAKGELAARHRQQQKQDETRQLAEAREIRMAALKKAKREKMLQRKKQLAAKKNEAELIL